MYLRCNTTCVIRYFRGALIRPHSFHLPNRLLYNDARCAPCSNILSNYYHVLHIFLMRRLIHGFLMAVARNFRRREALDPAGSTVHITLHMKLPQRAFFHAGGSLLLLLFGFTNATANEPFSTGLLLLVTLTWMAGVQGCQSGTRRRQGDATALSSEFVGSRHPNAASCSRSRIFPARSCTEQRPRLELN